MLARPFTFSLLEAVRKVNFTDSFVTAPSTNIGQIVYFLLHHHLIEGGATYMHPEFRQEQQRLYETIHYMETILASSKRNIETAQENIHAAMTNLEYIDSSDSFMNILMNTRFFEMARNQKEGLEAIQKKPYFARIHFQRTGEAEEYLYIGKTSLFHSETHEPIIVDWRSPVANVYYDGRLGDVSYDVRSEELTGHLFSKRQYKIDNGELLDFQDVDLTTNDELLQEALTGKADVRLTEIVSTIQKEQNDIIRAHLRQPIVVQGAAGSGKTTIALHRISYFLYTMGEHFKPEQLMILAPSKLFIDYIGDVLPELGVGKIVQTTYAEYVQNAIGIKLKLQNPNALLEQIIRGKASAQIDIAKLKGSKQYEQLLTRYLHHHELALSELFDDVRIEKYRILSGKHLKKLFLIEFAYMPIEKRLERIKKVIQTEVKRKTKAVMLALNSRYEDAIGRALNGMRDAEKRRKFVTKLIDERDERLPQIQQEAKSTTSIYMRKFEKVRVKAFYRTLLTNPQLLAKLAPDWTAEQLTQFLAAHKKEQWALEDLAALYYLHAHIKGIADDWKVRVVFIDEVQDYSYFQLAALKAGLETDMFTLVGDLAQGIHSYRALDSWAPVLELFPRATYATLQKSYRTTIEIMHIANQIFAQMDESLPLVEPVVRHGLEPAIMHSKELKVAPINKAYEQIRANGHKAIALICKTTANAEQLLTLLAPKLPVQLLTEDAQINSQKLLIVPCHLAKGLEFDAVIAVIVDEPYYDTPTDRKLLYVALTRAMHELYLIGPTKKAFLL